MKPENAVRIGAGAGTSDDRLVPALELAERGDIDYLVFECLAERTVSRENLSRSKNPDLGYAPSLHSRLRMVLPACIKNGIRIVSNMGAANPLGGARAARKEAADLGLGDVAVAVVLGDDVSSVVQHRAGLMLIENGEPLESILPKMISANAYLGADVVCEALNTGAPIVLSGRVADPSLFLAPMLHEFDWSYDDTAKIAQGTAAGHLLECTASVTGGCFGWPGKKDVPDLANNGYPFADVTPDGGIVIGKTPDSGGRLDVMTCTEQLIYEIHDPTAYITPDCVLDISGIALTQEAADRVRVSGARAKPRTPTYKVNVGYADGYIGEGEVSYGGIDAVARAKWAAEVVKERLRRQGFTYDDFRMDLIGMSSLHGEPEKRPEPYEVRLRLAGRTHDRKAAHAIGFETRALHMHGPGGAGGACEPRVRDVLAVKSVLLPKNMVNPQVVVEGTL
ncbi:MAG TPA: acyclic terpene utilization AtuA family protein [Pseudolabrys sp.]|nr:acyclic terpene utilization AtuA family protein [Pseudolabrys sp.]